VVDALGVSERRCSRSAGRHPRPPTRQR
jgi:hypothetical protein